LLELPAFAAVIAWALEPRIGLTLLRLLILLYGIGLGT
jgi:hypothetical protein